MRVRDAGLLAYTKFRTRLVRTLIVGLMAGLVFVFVLLAALLIGGMSTSIAKYGDRGYGNRFIAEAYAQEDYQKIDNEAYRRISAEMEANGETPPPQNDPAYYDTKYDKIRKEVETEIYGNSDTASILAEYKDYNPKTAYLRKSITAESYMTGYATSTAIIDGKEATATNSSSREIIFRPNASISDGPFHLQGKDREMITPFVLDQSAYEDATKIPILIPMQAAIDLSGEKIDPKQSLKIQVEQKAAIRQKYLGSTLRVCLRNAAAALGDVSKVEQSDESTSDKPCEIKSSTDGTATIMGTVGAESTPKAEIVEFTIVGFTGTPPSEGLSLSSFVQTGPVGEYIVPTDALDRNKFLGELANQPAPNSQPGHSYVEFNSAADLIRFVEGSCQYTMERMCGEQDGDYIATIYGNPRLAVDQELKNIAKGAKYVLAVVVGVASLLMMLAISKVISDSRRETGVFRAIGAKRRDIAQIYTTFAAMLAAYAFVIALVIATAIAAWLNAKYGNRLTLEAMDDFAIYENAPRISLLVFNPLYLGVIFGLALLAGVIGSILPILGNVRRDPIKDMRDE